MKIHNVIIRPLVTEKATQLAADKVYAFQVHTGASKHQVAQALIDLYGVTVAKVRVVTRKGKARRSGRTMKTKQLPDVKIAYVHVTKGEIPVVQVA